MVVFVRKVIVLCNGEKVCLITKLQYWFYYIFKVIARGVTSGVNDLKIIWYRAVINKQWMLGIGRGLVKSYYAMCQWQLDVPWSLMTEAVFFTRGHIMIQSVMLWRLLLIVANDFLCHRSALHVVNIHWWCLYELKSLSWWPLMSFYSHMVWLERPTTVQIYYMWT